MVQKALSASWKLSRVAASEINSSFSEHLPWTRKDERPKHLLQTARHCGIELLHMESSESVCRRQATLSNASFGALDFVDMVPGENLICAWPNAICTWFCPSGRCAQHGFDQFYTFLDLVQAATLSSSSNGTSWLQLEVKQHWKYLDQLVQLSITT